MRQPMLARPVVLHAAGRRTAAERPASLRRAAAQSTNGHVPAPTGDTVLAQIAALDGMAIAELRDRWRELFGAGAPRHSRPYIVSQLAYRIQELAYGARPERRDQRHGLQQRTRPIRHQ